MTCERMDANQINEAVSEVGPVLTRDNFPGGDFEIRTWAGMKAAQEGFETFDHEWLLRIIRHKAPGDRIRLQSGGPYLEWGFAGIQQGLFDLEEYSILGWDRELKVRLTDAGKDFFDRMDRGPLDDEA